MTTSVAAKSVRRDLYDQIASIAQDPAALPLADALKRVESCLETGECLLAANACESLAKITPDNPRLIQLWALALARAGAANKANGMMVKLAASEPPNEETLGLLARTYKDLWLQTGDRKYLSKARDIYLNAYQLTKGSWSGINAATLALLSGDRDQGSQMASSVLESLGPMMAEFVADMNSMSEDGAQGPAGEQVAVTSSGSQRYWDYATIGEAALILDRLDLAGWAYKNAIAICEGNLGNRASSKRNAELVLSVNSAARELIAENFAAPQVVVFSGHMLDAPGRAQPRFQPTAESAVYKRMLATLSRWEAQIGFSGAAGGADILFLEALKELGGETNIVLPHPPEMFIATSVAPAHGPDWIKRFERVMSDSRHITVMSDFVGDDVAFYFSGVVMAGLAKLRASQVCGQLRGLTVWDMKSGLIGGTGGTVSDWLRRGVPVDRLSAIAEEEQLLSLDPAQGFGVAESLLKANPQKVISMLFADAVGFSKLSEAQIPPFVERFLGGVREAMDRQAHAPLTVNTWGDGLFFTFESVIHANEFALDLSELVNATNWKEFGLPAELNLRIALHAGPAFEILDPVTRNKGFTGTHVSRAARIEPVTPPGYVYCSESHASLVALENNDSYHCEFVGNMPYAKNYGVFPTYSLTRRKVALA